MTKPLTGPQRRFCEAYAADQNAAAAYRLAYPNATDASARASASKLLTKDNIRAAIDRIRKKAEERAGGTLLSIVEKRQFLASIVRTPIGSVDEKSPIAQSAEYDVTEKGRKALKLKLCDKLKAMELDAKLSGELEEKVSVTVAHLPPADVLEKVRAMSPILGALTAQLRVDYPDLSRGHPNRLRSNAAVEEKERPHI